MGLDVFEEIPRISLAQLPTPLEQVTIRGFDILIKRDDLTGCVTSGNKIRKMEFLVADAREHNATTLITFGAVQSNHARTVAAVAAKLGFKCELYLWSDSGSPSGGNFFLSRLFGAEVHVLPKAEYDVLYRQMLSEEHEGKYVIPEGGSNGFGVLAYALAVSEIKEQLPKFHRSIDVIVTAAGTGGTGAGLLLGAKLFDVRAQVAVVNVLYPRPEILHRVRVLLEQASAQFSLPVRVDWERDVLILDGYSREGYTNIAPMKAKFIIDMAQEHGLVLDPIYTGKALYGLTREMRRGGLLEGARPLFVHTGGIFGLFAKQQEFERSLR
ncbi:MAG: 1-aminocyclopropane-1-carboxylate deaminase/D-cysteine desulfhydrase [Bacteroidota bacterium]